MSLRFNQIDQIYMAEIGAGRANWDRHASTVHKRFVTCESNGMNQQETYDNLVEWLVTTADVHRVTAEALIAYFIQKCEVFYAAT